MRLDTPTALAQLSAAFALALARATLTETSGLVEQQRRFRQLAWVFDLFRVGILDRVRTLRDELGR